MKKILAILMCFTMIVSMMTVVSFAADATLTIGTIEANPGDVIEVPVYFKATTTTSQVAVMLNAATGLTCQSVVIDSTVPVSSVANTNLGMLMINAGFASAQATYDGCIGTYTFKVADNASGEIALTTRTVAVKNGNAAVACDVVAGKIIVGSDQGGVTSYNVVFKDADGNEIQSSAIEAGNEIGTLPTAPEKIGYTFVGWFTDDNKEIKVDTVVDSDIIATAKYEENASDVTKVTIGTVEATPGAVVEVPVYFKTSTTTTQVAIMLNPVTGLTCQNIVIDSSVPVSSVANTNLGMLMINAGFASAQATYDGCIGTYTFKVADNAYNGDIALTTRTVAVKNGTAVVDCDVIAGKITVTGGQDRPPVYNVVVKDADGNELAKGEVDGGNTVGTLLPDGPKVDGKNFIKWVDAAGNDVTSDTIVNADMEITPVYEVKTFTVAFVNGTETVEEITVEYGQKVTLPTAPTKEGHTFKNWTDANGKEVNAETVVTDNITATANFDINKYDVTFKAEGANDIVVTVDWSTAIGDKMPAKPEKEGYTFINWTDADGKEVNAETVVTDKITATANFDINIYNVLFFETEDSETAFSGAEIEYGKNVTLPTDEPEKIGHTFAGWFADGVKIDANTVVKSDIKAIAKFDINTYDVIFNSEESNEVLVVEHGAVIPEDKIPEAAKKDGYNFVKWVLSKDCDGVDEAEWINLPEFDFATEITEDLNLQAVYEEIKIDIEVVGADGKAVDNVTVPYGTAIADIAKAIDDAITVNVVEDAKVIEADVKFDALDIKERVATVTIAYGDYSKEINVAYETKDAYIAVENADMLLLYPDYDGKSDDELAKFIYENAGIVVFDEYGIATTQDYTVTFAKDAKDETLATATVTAKYNDKDLEAKEIKVTLQPLGSSSSASGTVVRPSTGVVTGGGSANKPSTDKPATDDPATDDPATDEPATDDPATDEPATDDPATDEPATDDPATDAPATDAPAADVPFTDVKADDWALDAIKDLHSRGIISGDESKALRPDSGITREEVSKIVLNVKGIEVDSTATIDATDAGNVSEWAKGFVATAIKEGLLKGYEDGTVQSGKVVTRAELAAILVRAIGATAEFTASSFTDVGDAWYAAEVECAKNLGIVTGYEDGSFQGDKPVTRREAFAMAQRVIKLIEALENN